MKHLADFKQPERQTVRARGFVKSSPTRPGRSLVRSTDSLSRSGLSIGSGAVVDARLSPVRTRSGLVIENRITSKRLQRRTELTRTVGIAIARHSVMKRLRPSSPASAASPECCESVDARDLLDEVNFRVRSADSREPRRAGSFHRSAPLGPAPQDTLPGACVSRYRVLRSRRFAPVAASASASHRASGYIGRRDDR